MSVKIYNFPVFFTQGGGLVRPVVDNPFDYVFVEVPVLAAAVKIGDVMPRDWEVEPANDLARNLLLRQQLGS